MTSVRLVLRVAPVLALIVAGSLSYQPLLESGIAQNSPASVAAEASAAVSTDQFELVRGDAADASTFRPSGRPRSVLRHTGLDAATYRATKDAAAFGQADQAESLAAEGLEPRVGPLAVTGIFAPGLDMNTAGNLRPPDTNVAVSPDRVIQIVNTALRMWDRTPNAVLGTISLNAFFGVGSPVVFDPWIVYDRLGPNQRFYVVALRGSGSISEIRLAISRTANPTNFGTGAGGWCKYVTSGHRNLGTANASWADYDRLGVGEDKAAITTNQFRISNDTFTFAIVRVFNKLLASNNAAGCPAALPLTIFQPAGAVTGNFNIFTLVPALQYTAVLDGTSCSNPLYIVNNRRVGPGFPATNFYQVRRVCNLAPITLQGPGTIAGSFTYAFPPDSPQPGSPPLLDTGDTRVTQVQGRALSATQVELSTVHGTACQFTPGTSVEACVRHVRIVVSGAAGFLSINHQHAFCFGDNSFCYWPGTAINRTGKMVVGWQRSGAAIFLTSQYIDESAAGAFVGGTVNLGVGSCEIALGLPVERTGDYFGAHTDPLDFLGAGGGSFLLAGERAALLAGVCKWSTNIQRQTF